MSTQPVCGYISHECSLLLCVSYPMSVSISQCLSIRVHVPVCMYVTRCLAHQLGLLRMMWRDTAGWWVLVLSEERQGNKRSSDIVFLTYHHIDKVLSVGVCVCICRDSLSTCSLTPQTTPVSGSAAKAASLSGCVHSVTAGAAVCLVAQTRWGFLCQAEVGCPLCQPWRFLCYCCWRETRGLRRSLSHTHAHNDINTGMPQVIFQLFEKVLMSWKYPRAPPHAALFLSLPPSPFCVPCLHSNHNSLQRLLSNVWNRIDMAAWVSQDSEPNTD